MTITILLADDHAIVRSGLRLLLDTQPDMQVIGEAQDGWEAVRLVRQLRPHIAILDVAMPRLNGIDAIVQIHAVAPNTQVIILSMHADSEYVHRALRGGARGYILKESAPDELIEAIVKVQAGHRFLTPTISDELIANYIQQPYDKGSSSPLEQLTERERQVLQLVVESKTSSEIGEILSLSPKTVDTYRSRLTQKLNIRDLPTLVKFAIQHGITTLE